MNGEKHNSIISRLLLSAVIILTAGVIIGYVKNIPHEYRSITDYKLEKVERVRIVIVGDIMLDRNVRNKISEIGFDKFFSGIKSIISNADIAVGNLEGPITTYESITASLKNKALQFTFDPALTPQLAELGFDVFGLANNHTYNFGREGFSMTKKYLRTSGILYYGDPDNTDEISIVTEKNGIRLGFVGFHEFSYKNYDKVFAEIAWLRPNVDVLIVSPHWGIEYKTAPTDKMREWAQGFIDSGADAVIGAHPHVVGEVEEYKGKKIYYSLGNFAFDQYFSEATMKGLMVDMNIIREQDGKFSISYKDIPVRVDRKGISLIVE